MKSWFHACALPDEQAEFTAATRPPGATRSQGGGGQGLRAASYRRHLGYRAPSVEMPARLPPVWTARSGRTAPATTAGFVRGIILRRRGRRNQMASHRKPRPRDHPGEHGRHNRGRPALAFAVTALATAFTGCGLTPSTAGTTTSAPSTPAAAPATTAPVQIPARAPNCASAALDVSLGHPAAQAGKWSVFVTVINNSGRPCAITGWPQVAGRLSNGGTSVALQTGVPPSTASPPQGPPRVVLEPGSQAMALLQGSDAPGCELKFTRFVVALSTSTSGREWNFPAFNALLDGNPPGCAATGVSYFAPATSFRQ